MAQATVDSNTRRRDFLALTAAVATVAMAARPALASARSFERVPDPILAAIETHRVAAAATVAVHNRLSAFEDELQANERLQRDRRHEDETRRGEEIETAIEEALHFEQVAAYELLDVNPTN